MDKPQDSGLADVSNGIVIVDRNGQITFLDSFVEELFGYPHQEILGGPIEQLFPDGLWEPNKVVDETLFTHMRSAQRTLWGRHKDGHQFRVEVNLIPRRNDRDYNIICVINGSVEQIVPVEERLRLQSAALEAAHNAIVITDIQGTILWVNPAFSHLTGYRIQEAIGQNPHILNSGFHDDVFFGDMWNTILAGLAWQGTITNRRKDGDLYTEEMTITPVRNALGEIANFIAVKIDVTESVRRDKEIRQLYVAEHRQRVIAEALHDVSRGLSVTQDVDKILDSLMNQINRVVPFDSGSVLLVQGDRVHVAHQRGYEQFGDHVAGEIAAQTFQFESLGHLREIAVRGKPLIISDTATHPGWVHTESSAHIRSWIGAPIFAQNEAIAFFSLDKTEPNYYRQEHARQLAAFAGQASLAIQNARLFETERRRVKELEALRATFADFSAELELSKLLRAILERAAGLLNAAGGELGLYDEENEELLIVVSNYLDTDYGGERRALGEGAMGQAARTLQPLIVEDYQTWEGSSSKYEDIYIHAVMAAPLLAGSRLVGAISIADPDPDKVFSESDLNLLNMFAQQAAVAVENARLFEAAKRRAQEAETLRQAGAVVVAALHQGEAIERILEQLARVVPHDSASVQLLQEGFLEVVGGHGWPNLEAILGLRLSIPGDNPNTEVIQDRKPVILSQVDSRQFPFSEHIQSWLGVPLVVRDQVSGMLAVDSAEVGHFTRDHARLVTAFADQVAIALENAQLFEGAHRRAEEFAVLHSLAVAGAEATDEDGIIHRATQIICEKLFPDVFGIFLLDPGATMLRPHVSSRLPPGVDPTISVPLGYGVAGIVAATGKPDRIPDVRREPRYIEWVQGIRSVLCVPLIIGERVIGAINAESLKPNAFSDADEKLLVTFAQQLATVIEKVRLYQSAIDAAETRSVLYRASQEIGASLHPDQIYTAIHKAAEGLMPCGIFVIAMLDRSQGDIKVPYLFESGQLFPPQRVPSDQGLSGYVISSGESIRTDDFAKTHADKIEVSYFGEAEEDATSMLAVPMRLGAEVIGMLSAQSFEPSAYTAEDRESLELLASQAAIALNNADLFEATRRQLDELVMLHAISAAGAKVTSENVLIEQATELIGATLNPDNFGVFLVDQDKGVLRKHLTYRRIQAGNAEGGGGGTLQLGEGICGLVAERGQSWRISDVRLEPAYKVINPRIRSELCVPIKVGERVIGVVNAESAQLDAFTEAEEQLLETFAAQLATAIEKVRLFEEVQRLAITDSLTGLYNRRHFFELAGREYQRARRYKRPLTAVMLDLDHFKNVNDTHGHATGDQVLESLAMICKNELREIDILGRYGGEEFCVLLPESNLLDARKVATRLCQRIQETTFETDRTSVKITISLGIAELDSTCKDLDELLNRADVALYTAKQQGRNRVRVFASVLS